MPDVSKKDRLSRRDPIPLGGPGTNRKSVSDVSVVDRSSPPSANFVTRIESKVFRCALNQIELDP